MEQRTVEELETLLESLKREQEQLPALLKAAVTACNLDGAAALWAKWKILPAVILACQTELTELTQPGRDAQYQAEVTTLENEVHVWNTKAKDLYVLWQASEAALRRETPHNLQRYLPAEKAHDAAKELYDEAARQAARALNKLKEAQARHHAEWENPEVVAAQLDRALLDLLALPDGRKQ